jgi:hypothetical protein
MRRHQAVTTYPAHPEAEDTSHRDSNTGLEQPEPPAPLAGSSRWKAKGRAARLATFGVLLAFLVIGAAIALRVRFTPNNAAYPSVLVLPFGADTVANEYLADGIAESLINALEMEYALRRGPRRSASRARRRILRGRAGNWGLLQP